MFKPVSMLHMRAILLEEDERAVLLSLGRQGVVHLTRTPAGPDTAPLQPYGGTLELDRCGALLDRCNKLMPAEHGPPVPHELSLDEIDASLRQLEENSTTLLAERQRLLSQKQELDSLCSRVSDCRELGIPLEQLDRFSFLHFILGSVPEERLETLSETLGGNAVILPLPLRGGRNPVLIMITPKDRQRTEDRLQQVEFQYTELPAMEGLTPTALLEAKNGEQAKLAGALRQADERLQSFAVEAAQAAAAIRERVVMEQRLIEARQNFPRTETALLLSGWVPAEQAPSLRDHITSVTRGKCVIDVTEPRVSDGVAVPVALRHSGWLHPFQRMVTAYGLPFYQDLEPTFFVAVSYVLMFGMMFGDAGQGAILALAGWIALRSGRKPMMRDAGHVLLLGGLSSIGFGLVYGSYFGIPRLKAYALWRDPLEGDPLALMLTAIGMGIALISIGLILNILNRFRRKEMAEGWLGRFGIMGVLFYWGSLALLAKFTVLQSQGLAGTAAILFLALPLLGWMLKEPVQAAWRRRAGKPAESGMTVILAESFIGILEGVTAYLANTTSFVRLAAYAMSHAALLMAVFTVADQVRLIIPHGGGAWALLVIILGNGIAIVLEGIIAAVQALRLEYYEFFGKFLSGAGLPFSPFNLTSNDACFVERLQYDHHQKVRNNSLERRMVS
jgi:V/A-type H+-transporting ATPase subunit I